MAPALHDYVLPISVVIILLLFAVQSRGTGAVSVFFGPITLIWFLVMAAAGNCAYRRRFGDPVSLQPALCGWLLMECGPRRLHVLGAIFLTVTGAEALYADLGHFVAIPSRRPGLRSSFRPRVELSRTGRAGFVPSRSISNPFFLMFPDLGLVADGDPCYGRNNHRQPVGDHRSLFAYTASDPPRLPAPLEICYTSETQTGSDLPALGQHHPFDRCSRSYADVR